MLEMRELKGPDIFAMISILGKLDIEDEIVKLYENPPKMVRIGGESEKNKEERQKAYEESLKKRGIQIIASITKMVMQNIDKAKDEINSFLAELTSKTVKDIENLNIAEYSGLLVGFFRKKELKDSMKAIISVLSSEADIS